MKYIAFIILLVSILQACDVSNKTRYDTYRNNLILGMSPSNTAYRLVPMNICPIKKDSIVFAISDLQYLKDNCYEDLTYSDFNSTIGKLLFDRENCFTSICDSKMVVKVNRQKFERIERSGINRVKKMYFSDGRSKTCFSDSKPPDEFLAALVVLFYNNYMLHWGDDEYIYIKKAPENSKMNIMLNQ